MKRAANSVASELQYQIPQSLEILHERLENFLVRRNFPGCQQAAFQDEACFRYRPGLVLAPAWCPLVLSRTASWLPIPGPRRKFGFATASACSQLLYCSISRPSSLSFLDQFSNSDQGNFAPAFFVSTLESCSQGLCSRGACPLLRMKAAPPFFFFFSLSRNPDLMSVSRFVSGSNAGRTSCSH